MPVRLKIGPLSWTDDVLEELGGDPDFAFGLENERIIDAAERSAELGHASRSQAGGSHDVPAVS